MVPTGESLSRRVFTQATFGAFLAGSHLGAFGGDDGPLPRGKVRSLRLHEVTLAARDPGLAARFYAGLGFGHGSRNGVETLTIGASRLHFRPQRDDVPGDATHHFAFIIPEDRIRAAHAWLLAHDVPVLTPPPRLRDPAYPDDIVHFRHWNAHSVFFPDPAGNFVELIARHTFRNPAGADAPPFGHRDCLGLNEIAWIVDDVAAVGRTIADGTVLARYGSASDQFAAYGDDSGLLLTFHADRRMDFGTGPQYGRHASDVVMTCGSRLPAQAVQGLPYRLRDPE